MSELDSAPASVPWTAHQAVVVAGANGLGALLLVVARLGSGGTRTLDDQIGWLNLAVLALLVAASGNAGLLFLGRQAVGRRRRRVAPDVVPAPTIALSTAARETWLRVPGAVRAHRPGCQLVAGKSVVAVDGDIIRSELLQRCEVCG